MNNPELLKSEIRNSVPDTITHAYYVVENKYPEKPMYIVSSKIELLRRLVNFLKPQKSQVCERTSLASSRQTHCCHRIAQALLSVGGSAVGSRGTRWREIVARSRTLEISARVSAVLGAVRDSGGFPIFAHHASSCTGQWFGLVR